MVISGMLLWKGRWTALITIGIGAFFLLMGLFAPKLLGPIERVWLKFGEKLSVVMTYVIVTITFFMVVTPIALITRLIGRDALGLKIEPERESYWEPTEKDGPGTRPYLPY